MSGDREELEGLPRRWGDEVEVDCQCGHRFAVRRSLKGGLVNCPACRRATAVPGGPEPLFWILLAGGVLVALLLTIGFAAAFGTAAGVITLAVSAAILLVLVLAS